MTELCPSRFLCHCISLPLQNPTIQSASKAQGTSENTLPASKCQPLTVEMHPTSLNSKYLTVSTRDNLCPMLFSFCLLLHMEQWKNHLTLLNFPKNIRVIRWQTPSDIRDCCEKSLKCIFNHHGQDLQIFLQGKTLTCNNPRLKVTST